MSSIPRILPAWLQLRTRQRMMLMGLPEMLYVAFLLIAHVTVARQPHNDNFSSILYIVFYEISTAIPSGKALNTTRDKRSLHHGVDMT